MIWARRDVLLVTQSKIPFELVVSIPAALSCLTGTLLEAASWPVKTARS